jgi:excisionase family DNA binding protein
MTDVLGENMTSIFDLPSLIDELGAAVKARVQDSFTAMGIALKQFMVVSITPTDETAKAIDERASMGAIGNMDAYMKFQAARAMSEAAKNPSGGGAAAGVGLGAGMGMGAGMAGMIANAMSSASSHAPQAPSTPAGVPAPGGVMTLEEAAAYLKVTPADIQAAIDGGELKAKKIGAQVRISKEAIDAYMAG